MVGIFVGALVGLFVGDIIGIFVGELLGLIVGDPASKPIMSTMPNASTNCSLVMCEYVGLSIPKQTQLKLEP